MIPFPQSAKPHEVAILYVYLKETHNPMEIMRFLHYASHTPIYETLKKYRDFLGQHRKVTNTIVFVA